MHDKMKVDTSSVIDVRMMVVLCYLGLYTPGEDELMDGVAKIASKRLPWLTTKIYNPDPRKGPP